MLLQYAEDIEGGSSDVEAKYRKMYEDDINPFAAFSKKVPFTLSTDNLTYHYNTCSEHCTLFIYTFLSVPRKRINDIRNLV